jgi:NADH-quinone oxidoreductase subunit N
MQTEVFPFTLFALSGMMTFVAANDLLTMFVALEVLSLPLYLMCGLARRRRLLSQEAAVKYFLLGAIASAFFLYGLALLYGYAGSVKLSAIAAAASGSQHSDTLLLAGSPCSSSGCLRPRWAVPRGRPTSPGRARTGHRVRGG